MAVEDEAEMKSIADTIVKNGISVRETERLAKKAGNGGTAAVKRKKKNATPFTTRLSLRWPEFWHAGLRYITARVRAAA